ncbi:hypothetical protein DDIC_02545 [Desulfovibrio desulfuricans]|uniref:dTDP-4-dehydrorhamnose 3,5-epimerase n=1 Tax=Desulfovibrio desulfuricans TaxID=876 RepID=A0A4P7UFL4_DESDE|nr:hypothetical protein DDIC_02545 [Desulfovibrio desulfuricans]
MVYVLLGSVVGVAIDSRHGSTTLGKWFEVELSQQNQ